MCRAPGSSMPRKESARESSPSGPATSGISSWWSSPPAGPLEGARHRHDRCVLLDRVHPPRRERRPVAHLLDGEADRQGVVAGPHEVAVQRVDRPRPELVLEVAHRQAGRHHALGEDLPAEDPAVRHPLALALEDAGRGGADARRGILPLQAGHRDVGGAELLERQHVDEVGEGGERPESPELSVSSVTRRPYRAGGSPLHGERQGQDGRRPGLAEQSRAHGEGPAGVREVVDEQDRPGDAAEPLRAARRRPRAVPRRWPAGRRCCRRARPRGHRRRGRACRGGGGGRGPPMPAARDSTSTGRRREATETMATGRSAQPQPASTSTHARSSSGGTVRSSPRSSSRSRWPQPRSLSRATARPSPIATCGAILPLSGTPSRSIPVGHWAAGVDDDSRTVEA